jgi:hypothetical protein
LEPCTLDIDAHNVFLQAVVHKVFSWIVSCVRSLLYKGFVSTSSSKPYTLSVNGLKNCLVFLCIFKLSEYLFGNTHSFASCFQFSYLANQLQQLS